MGEKYPSWMGHWLVVYLKKHIKEMKTKKNPVRYAR